VPLPATSPVTPVTLIPEDHQMYIQNVMTQVPMTTVQPHQQQQGVVQHQDYGSLGAFGLDIEDLESWSSGITR
jgi:hypothetical protein